MPLGVLLVKKSKDLVVHHCWKMFNLYCHSHIVCESYPYIQNLQLQVHQIMILGMRIHI